MSLLYQHFNRLQPRFDGPYLLLVVFPSSAVGSKFMKETTLHGLKFITESRRSLFERAFWGIAVFVSWAAAAGMISQVRGSGARLAQF